MGAPTFALHELGWHAFGQLCHTVLREILGQTVVSFLDTSDGGRDGAFAGTWSPSGAETYSGEFVVQCKHTSNRSKNLALSDLSDEIAKAARLAAAGRCDTYVLMTNAGVTGTAEEKIIEALTGAGVHDVVIFGSTWFDQILQETPRIRRLVPRLYGLGDLTQILDERAYRQARAVLDSMRSDLAKLVLTGTFQRAAEAVDTHRFVLLVGAPAVGKTTIAAQLALGATDAVDAMVVKLDTIADLKDRWNPDESQVFWLDDAFGATQFDWSSAQAWVRAQPQIRSLIDGGSVMITTSRDYILNAARPHLKPGAFPLLNESQVVVDVADLTSDERRQILYNHLRHGHQPREFLTAIQPHLDSAADHPGFTPELARRLSEPLFTGQLNASSPESVERFFSRPMSLLRDVMEGLDSDARAALGLVFVNRNWVASPIALNPAGLDLLDRLDSTIGGVTTALEALDGSLVHNLEHEGERGWQFAHPTMVDAYGELLRSPELLGHFIAGCPLEVLLSEITCGDSGVRGALVVPASMFDLVIERLDGAPDATRFSASWGPANPDVFLATRCNDEFLRRWASLERTEHLNSPGLLLRDSPKNWLVAKLHGLGLFPELWRAAFAEELIEYCVDGTDPAVLWDEDLRSVLTDEEWTHLLHRVRTESLNDLLDIIDRCTDGWDRSADPNQIAEPMFELVAHLPKVFPGDAWVAGAADSLQALVYEWIEEHPEEPARSDRGRPTLGGDNEARPVGTTGRSMFDDLV